LDKDGVNFFVGNVKAAELVFAQKNSRTQTENLAVEEQLEVFKFREQMLGRRAERHAREGLDAAGGGIASLNVDGRYS
jgi:hypothetical protein